MITTIILNWNRAALLQRAVDSYLATAGADRELFVVDNGSSDGSREYLQALERNRPEVKVICLDSNEGGMAYNRAIEQARGELIHLSENDQIFLPGWFEHVQESFACFPKLGQLSLIHDMPTDDEAAGPQGADLAFSNGKILYQAHHNVLTSSILRGEIFRQHGVRLSNIERGAFKFPNDVKLSADVRAAGFGVAFSDRYYVRNVGHETEEMEQNPAYYEENYASKPWLGIAGMRTKMAQQKAMPRPQRASFSLRDRHAVPEKTPHSVKGIPARIWSRFDDYTAETEVVDFLHALVRLVKPVHVLETGTWIGLSASAIAMAQRANGFGRLTTLEINADVHATAQRNFRHYGVDQIVDAHLGCSLEHTPEHKIDMLILDADPAQRAAEFARFRPMLNPGSFVVLRDTAESHGSGIGAVGHLIGSGELVAAINFPTPRGLFVGMLRG